MIARSSKIRRLARARAKAITGALAVALALSPLPIWAQDSSDVDSLFGDEEMIQAVPEGGEGDAAASMLVSKAVRVGGSFSGSADINLGWNDPWTTGIESGNADTWELAPAISALVFFDARPSETARFYGSVKTAWPFYTEQDVVTGVTYIPGASSLTSTVKTTDTTLRLPDIRVFELFSDFNWNDRAYFRFGKQTVSWGVGYFFSPADVLNLQAIDPMNPTAQREGPVTLRLNVPIPNSQHNIWAYGVVDTETLVPEDIAAALKGEFVIGGWELGVGGYYKRDTPLRGVLTASGSVRDWSLFGEATLSRGSSKKWVNEVSASLPGFASTVGDDESAFFRGTAGFMYNNSNLKLTLAGQYMYDGEGYADADRKARITEAHDSEAAIKAALAMAGADPDAVFSGFLKGLIANSGRHYAAISVSRSELFIEDLSLSLFAMANLSDYSGFVKPSLSWAIFNGMKASIGATFVFGAADSEYLVLFDGPAVNLDFGLTLGSGAF
jgi:hypothetical protein